jgi:hypothetical protein
MPLLSRPTKKATKVLPQLGSATPARCTACRARGKSERRNKKNKIIENKFIKISGMETDGSKFIPEG